MKKKSGIFIGAAVLACVLVFFTYQSNAEPEEPIVRATETTEVEREKEHVSKEILSIEEAKQMAMKEFDGKVVEIELDKDDGRLIYEIELKDGKREAELDLDAETGEIIELEIEIDD